LEQVQRLVQNGVEVNSHDYDGRTGLHLAACEGRGEVVAHLLAARADASQRDRFGNTALDDAIRHGHASIKRQVYDAGARVSGMSNVLKACAASADGDPQAIDLTKNLVDNGLDPKAGDYDGRTPLHLAACSGKLGLLEYFISTIKAGGADTNGGDSESHFNVVDRYGYTPLDDADRHGHAAAIVVLEAAGAMRRGDPRLTEFVEERRLRDREQRRAAMRGEAAAMMKSSSETLAWAQVRSAVLT
jgi:ankyrin repeat protein